MRSRRGPAILVAVVVAILSLAWNFEIARRGYISPLDWFLHAAILGIVAFVLVFGALTLLRRRG